MLTVQKGRLLCPHIRFCGGGGAGKGLAFSRASTWGFLAAAVAPPLFAQRRETEFQADLTLELFPENDYPHTKWR